MQNKPTITYELRGKKETKKINLISINKILYKRIKGYYFVTDIKSVYFKNINFKNKKELNFRTLMNNTTVLLENCHFNCSHLSLEDCNYILINPIFEVPCEIKVGGGENIDISLSETKSDIKINISGYDNFYLESSKNLKELKVGFGNNAHIKNISNDNLDYYVSHTSTLILENSILTKSNINVNKLTLKNSRISTIEDINLGINELILENSSLSTEKTIYLKNLNNIDFIDNNDDSILDTSSYIEADENIIFGENKILSSKNKNEPIIITKENYSTTQADSRRLLTNTLKEIKIKLENNINQSINKEKEELLKQLEEKQKHLLKTKIKKLN